LTASFRCPECQHEGETLGAAGLRGAQFGASPIGAQGTSYRSAATSTSTSPPSSEALEEQLETQAKVIDLGAKAVFLLVPVFAASQTWSEYDFAELVAQTLPLTLFAGFVAWIAFGLAKSDRSWNISGPWAVVVVCVVLLGALWSAQGISEALGVPVPPETEATQRVEEKCSQPGGPQGKGPNGASACLGGMVLARLGEYFNFYGAAAFLVSLMIGLFLGFTYASKGAYGLYIVLKSLIT
jgi:hypothetical protein